MPTNVTGEFGIDKVTGANVVPYDNSTTGLPNTVQGAIDAAAIKQVPQVTTTGTAAIDFTNLPTHAKRIKVHFLGFGTGSNSPPSIRLGGSSGVVTTGYAGSSSVTLDSTNVLSGPHGVSFLLCPSTSFWNSSVVFSGSVELNRGFGNASNFWFISGVLGRDGTGTTYQIGGRINVGEALTTIRILAADGTTALDKGIVGITLEA